MMRQSSVPLVGFAHQPGRPPIAVARFPGHPVHTGTHAHDFLVLFYAHRADVPAMIDNQLWTVSDGDLFVLAPGQVVAFEATPVDGWVVWFPAEAVRAAGMSWRSHPLLFPFARDADRAQRLHIPPDQRDQWSARFAALHAELTQRRDGYPEAALAHLTLLLVDASRLSARPVDDPLLAAVLDVIENRFAQPLSLADVAAAVALTPGHLTTVIRRRTGRTVQQWILRRRLQQARRLLSQTDLPVASVAHRSGFPDVSYFIKRFRAESGVTPARWRR